MTAPDLSGPSEAVLWVARDIDDRSLALFAEKPELHIDGYFVGATWSDFFEPLPTGWFPDLLPGECRRVTLTLTPKEADGGQ